MAYLGRQDTYSCDKCGEVFTKVITFSVIRPAENRQTWHLCPKCVDRIIGWMEEE